MKQALKALHLLLNHADKNARVFFFLTPASFPFFSLLVSPLILKMEIRNIKRGNDGAIVAQDEKEGQEGHPARMQIVAKCRN
jgi:hypothetical protein